MTPLAVAALIVALVAVGALFSWLMSTDWLDDPEPDEDGGE